MPTDINWSDRKMFVLNKNIYIYSVWTIYRNLKYTCSWKKYMPIEDILDVSKNIF